MDILLVCRLRSKVSKTLERFTLNGKRDCVPRYQVFPLIVVINYV